jgi:hypothetical protein
MHIVPNGCGCDASAVPLRPGVAWGNKKSRMEFANANKVYRKSGGSPTTAFALDQKWTPTLSFVVPDNEPGGLRRLWTTCRHMVLTVVILRR